LLIEYFVHDKANKNHCKIIAVKLNIEEKPIFYAKKSQAASADLAF